MLVVCSTKEPQCTDFAVRYCLYSSICSLVVYGFNLPVIICSLYFFVLFESHFLPMGLTIHSDDCVYWTVGNVVQMRYYARYYNIYYTRCYTRYYTTALIQYILHLILHHCVCMVIAFS